MGKRMARRQFWAWGILGILSVLVEEQEVAAVSVPIGLIMASVRDMAAATRGGLPARLAGREQQSGSVLAPNKRGDVASKRSLPANLCFAFSL